MYNVKPLGLDIKSNDRISKDGSLKENINMQWRDGCVKPLPNRIVSSIDVSGRSGIILHKVSDEDQINVLGFNETQTNWLAVDLAEDLGGSSADNGDLEWFGTITDGVYVALATPIVLPMAKTSGMTYTILNGMLYFMGNGIGVTEQYYKRLSYNINTEAYELKDMYAWKTLVPFYPSQDEITIHAPKENFNSLSLCGVIVYKFTLSLKSGEEVLHSPIYSSLIYGINRKSTKIKKDDIIDNIHTLINLDLEYENETLYNEEISAINIYCSVPSYVNEIPSYVSGTPAIENIDAMNLSTITGEIQRLAETPFYLVKSISEPTNNKLLLYVDNFDSDINIDLDNSYSGVNMSTIAAGEVIPTDDFSYHYLYGRISSFNGRIVVDSTKTVLSGGHMRSLTTENFNSYVGFVINTEDGDLDGLGYQCNKSLKYGGGLLAYLTYSRGIMSYPDYRASSVGGNDLYLTGTMRFFKTRKNAAHNMACAFDMFITTRGYSAIAIDTEDKENIKIEIRYDLLMGYSSPSTKPTVDVDLVNISYLSENRVQFSSVGEFSSWPVENSHRVGEGKIMKVGTNNVNPRNADVITPLLIGTSDGVFTVNADPTGTNLVSSITRIAKYPYISSESIQIDETTLFVSDKGLMAIKNDDPINLTKDFFPDQGDGDFPLNNTAYPNYNVLTNTFFGGNNPYEVDDIILYMKDSLFAYDSRREIIWCSNPNYKFSLLFSVKNKMWAMSTTVFGESIDLYGTLDTSSLSSNIGDVYSWFLVRENTYEQNNLLILSGEDMTSEVFVHYFTRPIKFNGLEKEKDVANSYKKITRLFSRCELYKKTTGSSAYFSFGIWGKQDINRNKVNIPLVAISDSSSASFPNDVRQDIPVGSIKGKYKTVSILFQGKILPDSSIEGIDFDIKLVDDNMIR